MSEAGDKEIELPLKIQGPAWRSATADDFLGVDINAPLLQATTIDCHEASTLYFEAASIAAQMDDAQTERAYSVLGAICSFYFKPSEPNAPFGPMMRSPNGRTAQPSDFEGPLVSVLASKIEALQHSGVRARVADTVWMLDRKRGDAGIGAVKAYGAVVEAIIDKTATLRQDSSEYAFEISGFLRRALQIGKAVGWSKGPVETVKSLVSDLVISAAEARDLHGFARLASLDNDYQISDPIKIAVAAENLAQTSDLHSKHQLMHCAARAYRNAKSSLERNRCLIGAAEALATIAQDHSNSAIYEVHWLEKAIAEMRPIPDTKQSIRDLKHRLVDSQSRIHEEMKQFSYSDDISDIVAQSESAVKSQSISHVLLKLAFISKGPSPEKLVEQARDAIAQHPLSSLFSTTHYDSHGKPVHREPAGGFGESDDAAVRQKIGQAEKIRRSLVSKAMIDPIRQVIMLEHAIDENVLAVICNHSAFVPPDRTAFFVGGLLRFFQGDMISALHILLPQLENSIRHVLKMHDIDVVKINSDMTQEDMGLTAIFDRLRPEFENIFGKSMSSDLENLLIYRGGPQLRDRLSHGLIAQWEPYSDDSIYACWLVYQLCCIPLQNNWEDLPIS